MLRLPTVLVQHFFTFLSLRDHNRFHWCNTTLQRYSKHRGAAPMFHQLLFTWPFKTRDVTNIAHYCKYFKALDTVVMCFPRYKRLQPLGLFTSLKTLIIYPELRRLEPYSDRYIDTIVNAIPWIENLHFVLCPSLKQDALYIQSQRFWDKMQSLTVLRSLVLPDLAYFDYGDDDGITLPHSLTQLTLDTGGYDPQSGIHYIFIAPSLLDLHIRNNSYKDDTFNSATLHGFTNLTSLTIAHYKHDHYQEFFTIHDPVALHDTWPHLQLLQFQYDPPYLNFIRALPYSDPSMTVTVYSQCCKLKSFLTKPPFNVERAVILFDQEEMETATPFHFKQDDFNIPLDFKLILQPYVEPPPLYSPINRTAIAAKKNHLLWKQERQYKDSDTDNDDDLLFQTKRSKLDQI